MTAVFVVGRTGPARRALRERLEHAGLAVAGDSPVWADAAASRADVIVVSGIDSLPLQPAHADGERDWPSLVIISDERSALRQAAGAGVAAWGVVPTTASAQELKAAVEAVRHGLAVATPQVLAGLGRGPAQADGPDAPVGERLTAREQHVLELMAEGRSNRAIAEALGISEHTVKFHLASIYGKLGASTRTEAVRRGLRRGLITI